MLVERGGGEVEVTETDDSIEKFIGDFFLMFIGELRGV